MNASIFKIFIAGWLLIVTSHAGWAAGRQASDVIDLRKSTVYNSSAYIPPQCYTKTEKGARRPINPCYVCHTRSPEPNYINDHDLQLEYSFPEPARSNPWRNLFEDRRKRIEKISDEQIRKYISENNYRSPAGAIRLEERLSALPEAWDVNGNGRWDGYTPDCYFNFDREGFDIDPDGKETGWRAFAYYPFPTPYWPTNGSADDILIRLAEVLQNNVQGQFDREVYRLNLAIVESVVKQRSVLIEPVDETRFMVDLDKDGKLGMTGRVVYDWAPRQGRQMSYVGQARIAQQNGSIHLAGGLFPEGTEFLHSIRYVGVDDQDRISFSPRMKELRYMKKRTWQTYADLEEADLAEVKEREDFPDRISQFIGNAEQGIHNGSGWIMQGFIEDAQGRLRPQSYEETLSCLGCHGGVGATADAVFGFPRKLDGSHHQGGWYHWSQKSLKGLQEPKIEIRGSGVYYEYAYYLMYNRTGSDLGHNLEVTRKFFNTDGTLREDMLDLLREDISLLLYPTARRALDLNKAYRTIVADQDFIEGREVSLAPLASVHAQLAPDQPTGVQRATNIQAFAGRFGPAGSVRTSPGKALDPSLEGRGMAGPGGIPYGVDWQGIIQRSRYALDIPGVYFTFPQRLTLPTRVIVPVAGNPACHACHRIDYPTVPGSSQIREPFFSQHSPQRTPSADRFERLTQAEGRNQNGVWSPDGSRIAFVSDREGSPQIWIMAQDGTHARKLSRGPAVHGWPQWHPDGQSLIAWSYDPTQKRHAIEILPVATGEARTLVTSQEMLDRPVFHPQGVWAAYAAQTQGNWDIWLVSTVDGQTVRLTRDALMESNPLWSADGTMLSYKIAPTTGAYNLTRQNFMTFEQGYETPLIHEWEGPQSVQMNHWSPNGRQIAYTAEVINDAAGRDTVSYAAMVSNLALSPGAAQASDHRLLAQGRTLGGRGPVFSPDGRRIAFWAWSPDHSASIWLYDRQTDSAKPLTAGGMDMYPQWSPDGRILLFESYVGGDCDLWSLRIED